MENCDVIYVVVVLYFWVDCVYDELDVVWNDCQDVDYVYQ